MVEASDLKKTVEAALFMSTKAVSLNELARTAKVNDLMKLEKIVKELKKDYSERDSAIEISFEGKSIKMQVKEGLEERVRHLATATEFSKAVMKTLAFIAYKQPIKQSLVIKYRTNKAYEEIKLLQEKGFISKEPLGQTFLLKTTKKFLSYFGKNAIKLKPNPKFEKKEESQEQKKEDKFKAKNEEI